VTASVIQVSCDVSIQTSACECLLNAIPHRHSLL
jgi:hypothetical protein